MKFHDYNYYKGHLQIYQICPQCFEAKEMYKLLYDEDNIVVSGMGTGLSRLFLSDGSEKVFDYSLTYFQLGVSGSQNLAVSTTAELAGPLTLEEYGFSQTIKNLNLYYNGLY